jgi:hypothetical protein
MKGTGSAKLQSSEIPDSNPKEKSFSECSIEWEESSEEEIIDPTSNKHKESLMNQNDE